MTTSSSTASTTTISVLTRHSENCSHKDKPLFRKCRCRKSLYIYENGKASYLSAKTRSWTEAEKFADLQRALRDPANIERAKLEAERLAIAEGEKAKQEAAKANEATIADALDQWIASLKMKSDSTTAPTYRTLRKAILAWSGEQGLTTISEVTPDALDAWVGSWVDASNTQRDRLSRVKAFFKWATGLRKIAYDPSVMISAIESEQEETQPLTKEQFEEVLAATYIYDDAHRIDWRFGTELRAIFLVQRWTGVRLSDALMLKRSAVVGNRIKLSTQKTGAKVDIVVPEVVLQALAAVPHRKTMHEDQYFWSRKCTHRVLAGMWTPRIRKLNEYLKLTHQETGEPLKFRSHMLRDTFAVELLLAGMSLEKVSKLLTHASIRVTEKHYAPWVPQRTAQLEDEMKVAMRKMGVSFAGD